MSMEAHLTSNSGTAEFSVLATGTKVDADGRWLVVDLAYRETPWSFVDVPDLFFGLTGVRVRAFPLEEFATSLRAWVELPLAELGATPLTAAASLGRSDWEYLSLEFGDRADTVSDRKPVFTFAYEGKFEACFVTDQSCVRIFEEGLREILGGY